MCGCEFNDPTARTAIDQTLMAPARAITRRLGGEFVSDSAWDIFFGRAGGGLLWGELQLMKQSYDHAAAIARGEALFRRAPRPRPRVCEPVAP